MNSHFFSSSIIAFLSGILLGAKCKKIFVSVLVFFFFFLDSFIFYCNTKLRLIILSKEAIAFLVIIQLIKGKCKAEYLVSFQKREVSTQYVSSCIFQSRQKRNDKLGQLVIPKCLVPLQNLNFYLNEISKVINA